MYSSMRALYKPLHFLYNNKLFSEENKALEHCLKLESWQGPPHINNEKQYEIVLSFKLSLFSHENKEFVYSVCSGLK